LIFYSVTWSYLERSYTSIFRIAHIYNHILFRFYSVYVFFSKYIPSPGCTHELPSEDYCHIIPTFELFYSVPFDDKRFHRQYTVIAGMMFFICTRWCLVFIQRRNYLTQSSLLKNVLVFYARFSFFNDIICVEDQKLNNFSLYHIQTFLSKSIKKIIKAYSTVTSTCRWDIHCPSCDKKKQLPWIYKTLMFIWVFAPRSTLCVPKALFYIYS